MTINLILFSISFLIQFFISLAGQPDDPLLDKKLAEKHGLVVPPPYENTSPAPEWLQKADMFSSDRSVWINHKFMIKDTVMTRIIRVRADNRPERITEGYPFETIDAFDGSIVKGVSLMSHVPHSKKAFNEAHKQGVRVIPYVHFTDIHIQYADQDVFYFQHPEIILKDARGKWMHIPMDGSDRLHRFLTCANSPSYWNLSLAYVKKMMDWGADGVFIDNVGRREPCFATKFTVRNPEFEPYVHEHLFPDTSHNYAWDRMIQAIRLLVKSYGEDKIVVLNSGIGTQFQKNGDCCMWESFIYSWAWEGRRHTCDEVKKRAQSNEWYLKTGRRITALSTINRERKEAKDDAFWAFSAARLVDFIWWASLNGTGAEVLFQAHMGNSLEPMKESNEIASRAYENGFIVLNDSSEDQTVELTVPATIKSRSLMDLYNNSQSVPVKNKKLKVTVPGKMARVYVAVL